MSRNPMQKSTHKLLHLVSIRGAAAWLIVFFHSIELLRRALPQLPATYFRFLEHGYLAVDFFFALSGFIIFINYYEKFGTNFRHNALTFYWNRITRIYPVHLLMLGAYLILTLAFLVASASRTLPAGYTSTAFLQSLMLVQAWTGAPLTWNVPSWSISAEWFVYLLFPPIAVFFHACIRSVKAHLIWAAIFFCAIFTIYTVSGVSSLGSLALGNPLVRALFQFLTGAVAGSLFIHHGTLISRYHGMIGVFAALLAMLMVLVDLPNYASVPLLFFLVVVFLSVDTGVLARALSNKVLVYLGEISYSTYMVHYFVYDVFKAGWVHDGHPVGLVPLMVSFLIVLLLSALMYRFVELPAQAYLRAGVFMRSRAPLRFRL